MYDVEKNCMVTINSQTQTQTQTQKKTKHNIFMGLDIVFFTLFISSFNYTVTTYNYSAIKVSLYAKILSGYYIFHSAIVKQDMQHNLHHIIAILHQISFIYYTDFEVSNSCIDPIFLQTMTIQYYMLITSIFSALRRLSKNLNWRYAEFLEYFYFYIFLCVKFGGNIIMWSRWYNNKYYTISLPCYISQQYSLFLITALQMYFSYKIIVILCYRCKKNKNKNKHKHI
jgi:hypothetical protein